ncbi:MAG: histidinol-phosphatase HisJ family protein [Clostridia bacterium]|nr:histidinol-phosphatase HisJ family protein [Clostridia bacterium]
MFRPVSDYHMHTTFSDGKNSPRQMLERAVELGLREVGISDHSYTPFDLSYCMEKKRIGEYNAELNALKAEFDGRIRFLAGIEQDFFSPEPTDGYDYVIGSVHYLEKNGVYAPIDSDRQTLQRAIHDMYGGDPYAMCEAYFENVSRVCERWGADIVGHIDLITKFNEQPQGVLIDDTHPRYREAACRAVDSLLGYDAVFEINTGAISRGVRKTPYHAPFIRDYIVSRGGKLILSSDAHNRDWICLKFDELGDISGVVSTLGLK